MQSAQNVQTPVDIQSRKEADIRAGDTVRVWIKIKEEKKTRLQAFEGIVIARKHGSEAGATFTVRRSTGGYGVEKIFPLYSPIIDKIEVIKRSNVRRAKLYYIREKAAREIRKKMRQLRNFEIRTIKDTEVEEEKEEESVDENTDEKAVEQGEEKTVENSKEEEAVVEKESTKETEEKKDA